MSKPKKTSRKVNGAGSMLSTVSGPSTASPPNSLGTKNPVGERLLEKTISGQSLAAAMPVNENKPDEYGEASSTPQVGATYEPTSPAATGSTASEITASNGSAAYKVVNVSKEHEVKSLMQFAKEQFGEINVVLACAGIIRDSFFVTPDRETGKVKKFMSLEEWQQVIEQH